MNGANRGCSSIITGLNHQPELAAQLLDISLELFRLTLQNREMVFLIQNMHPHLAEQPIDAWITMRVMIFRRPKYTGYEEINGWKPQVRLCSRAIKESSFLLKYREIIKKLNRGDSLFLDQFILQQSARKSHISEANNLFSYSRECPTLLTIRIRKSHIVATMVVFYKQILQCNVWQKPPFS